MKPKNWWFGSMFLLFLWGGAFSGEVLPLVFGGVTQVVSQVLEKQRESYESTGEWMEKHVSMA